ncbi:MAG: TetR/AcrR family transcriptional regulator [Glaciecola sp.]|jgi:TetR/AcrR family transcriptional regulator
MKERSKSISNIGVKRRSIILSAALRAFADNGYKGTSIQMIADAASLPKTNVLYYFATKKALYSEVMQSILLKWNSSFDEVTADDCPAQSLANYIADKMETSRTHPYSSKVFAIEIINGGQNLEESVKEDNKMWVKGRIAVLEAWIAAHKIETLNPEYLLYHIWSSTQHYADFSSQIRQLRGREMTDEDFTEATNTLVKLILKGCGLQVPAQYIS